MLVEKLIKESRKEKGNILVTALGNHSLHI